VSEETSANVRAARTAEALLDERGALLLDALLEGHEAILNVDEDALLVINAEGDVVGVVRLPPTDKDPS